MTASELKELRKSADLTMADAARLFQVPYRTWQNWENGDRRVPPMAGVILEMYKKSRRREGCTFVATVPDGYEIAFFRGKIMAVKSDSTPLILNGQKEWVEL